MNKDTERLLNKIAIKQENGIDCWDDIIDFVDKAIKDMPDEEFAKMNWEIDRARSYVDEHILEGLSPIPAVQIKEILVRLRDYLDVLSSSFHTPEYDLNAIIFHDIILALTTPLEQIAPKGRYFLEDKDFDMQELDSIDKFCDYYQRQIDKCLAHKDVSTFLFYRDISQLMANAHNINNTGQY